MTIDTSYKPRNLYAVQEAPNDPFNMEEEYAPVMGQQIMQFNNAAATVTDDADIPWQ
jgi:hypothetical protein